MRSDRENPATESRIVDTADRATSVDTMTDTHMPPSPRTPGVVEEIDEHLSELELAGTPIDELRAIHRLDVLVRRAKTAIVRNALRGHSYAAVARELNMTKQGVQQAWPRTVRPGRR